MILLPKIIKPQDMVLTHSRVKVYEEPGREPEAWEEKEVYQQEEEGGLIDTNLEQLYNEMKKRAEQTAAKILEDAYAQRDKVVHTAEEDALRTRERARQQGYEEGLIQAADRISENVRELSEEIEAFKKSVLEKEESLSRDVIEVSLEMARKILHKRIQEDETEMVKLVKDVVLSEKDKKKITVQIPIQMTRLLDELEKELEPVREKYQNLIKIKPVDMPDGSCRVDVPEGIIDVSVFVQLENLREELKSLEDKEI